MSLEIAMQSNIEIQSPFHPTESSVFYGPQLYSGSGKHTVPFLYLRKTIVDLTGTILPEAEIFMRDRKIERIYPEKEMIGVYSHLPEEVRGLMKRQSTESGLVNIIMLHADLVKDYMTKSSKNIVYKVAYYYTVIHEMFHSYFGLGESKNYKLLVDFFKHMSFISQGDEKRLYHNLEKYARLMLKGYNEHPYDEVHITKHYAALSAMLDYIKQELTGKNLSKDEKARLSKLEEKVKAQMQKAKIRKAEKSAASAKSGAKKDAAGKKPASKVASAKPSGKKK